MLETSDHNSTQYKNDNNDDDDNIINNNNPYDEGNCDSFQ